MASDPKRLKMNESDKNASCSTLNEILDFNFSTSNWSDLVNTKAFVDKTMLIKDIIFKGASLNLITAPPRFGKSTNMNMLKLFFEIQVDDNGVIIEKKDSPNYQIFKDNNLLIFQDTNFFDTCFATYPVIHTSFENVHGQSYDQVLECFRSVLNNTYSKHAYLLKSKIWSQRNLNIDIFNKYYDCEKIKGLDEAEIKDGLRFLSQCLYYHFDEKVFMLVDEYDGPINNTVFEKEADIENINNLLNAIFSQLNTFGFVNRVLLTGISYFAITGLPDMTNIMKYIFPDDHPFLKYYGLIESEVDALLSKFEISDEKVNDVKLYYNGYNSTGSVKLYSLWSVLHYLKTKELRSHWETSEIIWGLKEALRVPSIQLAIEKLVQDDFHREIKTFRKITPHYMFQLHEILMGRADKYICSHLFLTFLLQWGYLSNKSTLNLEKTVVTIPNNEIRHELKKLLYEYYVECTNSRVLDECTTAFGQMSVSNTGSFQKFVEKFQAVVDATSAITIKRNERIFNSLLYFVIFRSRFQDSDIEFSGRWHRSDLIVVTSGKHGIMIVFKFRQDCKKALDLIEKIYYTKFDSEEFKDLENKLYLAVSVSDDLRVSLAVLDNTLDTDKAEYFPR